MKPRIENFVHETMYLLVVLTFANVPPPPNLHKCPPFGTPVQGRACAGMLANIASATCQAFSTAVMAALREMRVRGLRAEGTWTEGRAERDRKRKLCGHCVASSTGWTWTRVKML